MRSQSRPWAERTRCTVLCRSAGKCSGITSSHKESSHSSLITPRYSTDLPFTFPPANDKLPPVMLPRLIPVIKVISKSSCEHRLRTTILRNRSDSVRELGICRSPAVGTSPLLPSTAAVQRPQRALLELENGSTEARLNTNVALCPFLRQIYFRIVSKGFRFGTRRPCEPELIADTRGRAHSSHTQAGRKPRNWPAPAHRHPCKSSVKEKHTWSGALARARTFLVKIFSSRIWCLSAVVPAFAEPDIHLLPRARQGLRRRLSWCSLPVSKQSVGSLRKVLISLAHSDRAGPGSLRALRS